MDMSANYSVYLDYAATTPAAPSVIAEMNRCLGTEDNFGNPASQSHIWGHNAHEIVEKARAHVAQMVNAKPSEVIWTSGATEANNLAVKGVVEAIGEPGVSHLVTSAIEHPAVLDTFEYLENQGYRVSYITPNSAGVIELESVTKIIGKDTLLVSLMHVNNEIGTITDIEGIGEALRNRNIFFHVDATQSVARLNVDVHKANIDLLSLSGHKIYGPKGIGALFVRRSPKIPIVPQIHGGGHEGGLRSGTLATHQIAGLGEAARLICENIEEYQSHDRSLKERAIESIENWQEISINGDREYSVDGIINITIGTVDASALMARLPHIAFSSGSACTSASIKPSHVLTALGLTEEQTDSTIRLSFGRFTTAQELQQALHDIENAVQELNLLANTG